MCGRLYIVTVDYHKYPPVWRRTFVSVSLTFLSCMQFFWWLNLHLTSQTHTHTHFLSSHREKSKNKGLLYCLLHIFILFKHSLNYICKHAWHILDLPTHKNPFLKVTVSRETKEAKNVAPILQKKKILVCTDMWTLALFVSLNLEKHRNDTYTEKMNYICI